MSEIDSAPDRALALEFRRRPYGRHSPALQHLLNGFRLSAATPHYVLVCRKPGREWVLASLGACRGAPIEILEDQVFHSREEAEWMRFRPALASGDGRRPRDLLTGLLLR